MRMLQLRMRIGITGGAGNISLYITRRLVAAGHDVVIFNRSGTVVPGAQTIVVDRSDTNRFADTVQAQHLDVGIDMIVFTAAQAEESVRAFEGVRQLIHCSTGATYGFPLPIPVTEEAPLLAEQHYGKNKREADAVFLRAHHADGFPVTILKPNITYGHRWTHRLPSQLGFNPLRRILDGKPILVVGDGDQLHHFHHADDSAKAFVGCVGNEATIGQIFNNTGTRGYTWREMHETTMRVLGRSVPIVGIPEPTWWNSRSAIRCSSRRTSGTTWMSRTRNSVAWFLSTRRRLRSRPAFVTSSLPSIRNRSHPLIPSTMRCLMSWLRGTRECSRRPALRVF